MRHPKSAQRVILTVLRWYQRSVSPTMPMRCRFVPTCSSYAMEAIDRHGVISGSWLTARRLLRCHPFVRGGFDPLPEEP